MAKVIGKGTVLKQTISSVLTAVAQVLSIETSGHGSENYESTDLDTGPFKTFALTGYSNPGKVDFEVFLDPNLAGHKALLGLAGYVSTAPATNVMNIVYVDGGPTTQSFTEAGIEYGVSVKMNDGLKAKFSVSITGDPGFPHP